ncbi:MAG: AAA family ATPase [Clostridiales bacterium]|nr:AAA family ATPase [Clostridiales bacterium]
MLKRKIYKQIEDFYKNQNNKALMITGARQVGKSYIIEKYAKENYSSYIRVDFIENPEYKELFDNTSSAADILLKLSAVFGDKMIPGKTIIFFDEVQECKELITQIKYLVSEGSYSYILSGSLLGTVMNDIRSIPVGYLKILTMYPLDFEEFAIANGVGENIFEMLRNSFDKLTPIDEFIHKQLMSLFELYLIVGGMPAAVANFIVTKNLKLVLDTQKMIIELYKRDISKYDKENKLYLNNIFDLIPSELNAKNKRFILKRLNENAKLSIYLNSFLWLKNAGVAISVFNANEARVPLVLSKSSNLFKLFLNDVGLLAALYGEGIQLKLLNGELSINHGAIYENFAAMELTAHGFIPYYYNNKKKGEVDFLIEMEGKVVPIEIKSGKDYYRHSSIDKLLENQDYGIEKAFVFCNGNIEKEGKLIYCPIYMLGCIIKKEISEDIILEADFSVLKV